MSKIWIWAFAFSFSFIPSLSWALPIGFNFNQGEFEYREIATPYFWIYHDARAPHEAAMVERSLEAVRPLLESWMGIQRSRPLPVIMSAESVNASFANLLTDAIELQTLGQGDRSTFQHEYVHMTMYLHLHDWLGPAGALLYLPWMPAWFLEGLAEALSISVRSDVQASIERYAALTNTWPTYDQLHSLYTNNQFAEEGYAISGAFVRWLLQQGDETKFPALMQNFFWYSTPPYYVFSANPFSSFMPMDAALHRYVSLPKEALAKDAGRKLYAAYQHAARVHWQRHGKGPLLSLSLKNHVSVEKASDKNAALSSAILFTTHLQEGNGFAVAKVVDLHSGRERHRVVRLQNGKIQEPSLMESQRIWGIYETSHTLIVEKQDYENTALCVIDLSAATVSVTCPLSHTLPQTVHMVGGRKEENGKYVRLWYRVSEQTLGGDRAQLWEWDNTKTGAAALSQLSWGEEYPLQVLQLGTEYWILAAEHNRRFLRVQSITGQCKGQVEFEDFVQQINTTPKGELRIEAKEGLRLKVFEVAPSLLPLSGCRQGLAPLSPLGWAVQQPVQPSLPTMHAALAAGSIWIEETDPQYASLRMQQRAYLRQALPLDQTDPISSPFKEAPISQPLHWRARPVLLFPWIGADDALGYQYGIVSVPLMDHLQNETLRLSFLYGPVSHYPNTDLSLISTRFWPTVTVSAYRAQVWDGFLPDPVSNQWVIASYLDEKGLRGEAVFPFYMLQQQWD